MRFSLERMSDFGKLIKELGNGLRKLTFEDNFESNFKEIELPANSETAVEHSLNKVPKYYIIVGQSAEGQIIDGDTPFDESFIYLKNTSANLITLKLIILR